MRTFFALLLVAFAGSVNAQSVPDQSPEALLGFVYQHYVGKSGADDVTFNWIDKPLVDQLFEPTLSAAIQKDSENNEESALGADPFVNGQDFDVKSAAFEVVTPGTEFTRINARLVNFGEPVTIGFDLVRVRGAWRIRDIIWGGDEPDTLRKALKLP